MTLTLGHSQMRIDKILFLIILLYAIMALRMQTQNKEESTSNPILFISYHIIKPTNGTTPWQLYSMNENGSKYRLLVDDSPHYVFDARWSPNGKEIAYSSGKGIYIINADGSSKRLLTSSGHHALWSPNGNQLAFERIMGGEFVIPRKVFVINKDGSDERPLTKNEEDNRLNDCSPDGSIFVFDGKEENVYDSIGRMCANEGLIFYNAEGKRLQSYGEVGLTLHHAVYSSSGKNIAFISSKTGRKGINIIDAECKNERRIMPKLPDHLKPEQYFYEPVAWSYNDSFLLCNAENNLGE
jgi:TolB protein